MTFSQFNQTLENNITRLFTKYHTPFTVNLDKDMLWDTYLNSFLPEDNPLFRERREYDCNCCRRFIKQFGHVVFIDADYNMVTFWSDLIVEPKYKRVTDALNNFVTQHSINGVFVHTKDFVGTKNSHEITKNGVISWNHFHYHGVPATYVCNDDTVINSLTNRYNNAHWMYQKAFENITSDAYQIVIDLIDENVLYRGEQWANTLKDTQFWQQEYIQLTVEQKNNFLWTLASSNPDFYLPNSSIGTLLSDLSENMDVERAVKRYENVVAPENYRRPATIFTQKMLDDAKEKIESLGYLQSIQRQIATLDDIPVTNVAFVNRNLRHTVETDLFTTLSKQTTSKPKGYRNSNTVDIESLFDDILPNAKDVQVLFDNSHYNNLVTMTTAQDKESPSMFSWNNQFGWSYNGEIADSSMKKRVKAKGGDVNGVLRFSLQWNDNSNNQNLSDLDAHCLQPNEDLIFYSHKGKRFSSSGILDVDIIDPQDIAVENISFNNIRKMPYGDYVFRVNCFDDDTRFMKTNDGSTFTAEIEFDNEVYQFTYNERMAIGETVTVATVTLDENGFHLKPNIQAMSDNKPTWGLMPNKFYPVNLVCLSPNHWENKVGNKHYFFMVHECQNDGKVRGFYNEFLNDDLRPHRKVLEAISVKTRITPTEQQLSGLGFSSTKRAEVILKIDNEIVRVVF